MNISAWAIRRPLPVALLYILLTLGGLYAWGALKVQDSPDIDFPVITARTMLPGASPPQLESEVARKIEGSVATLPDLRRINTTISDGVVETAVEFRLSKSTAEALDEVRDAVARVRGDLPAEVRDPVITKLNVAGLPILTYAISSSKLDLAELTWFVDSTLNKALLTVPGVGRVARVGGASREVLVELDPARLAALNVSAADVSRQLQRVQQEAPAGRADIGGLRQSVRAVATVGSVAEIAALDMALPDGRSIRLDQVATITDGAAEPQALASLDGQAVVGFEISRARGAGEVAVAEAVRAQLKALVAAHPQVQIREAANSVDAVTEGYEASMGLLREGALLTVLVVWWFLRCWRATLVSALALPLSLIPSLLVIYWLGFTLNTITLLSLALVIGVLVDDAIVEIENVMRHLRMGKTPLQAARDATDEIGLAVMATTLTLVAVFLPTAFMQGFVGQYFKQFGWTAAVAVLASLLVARLVTPTLAAYLLKPTAEPVVGEGRLVRRYLAVVGWCLKHRARTLGLSLGFFVLSLAMIPLLPTGFIPPADRAQTQVALELAPGSTLAQTQERVEQARQLAARDPDVRQVYAVAGGAEARKATLTVLLSPRKARHRSQSQIEAALRDAMNALPGVRSVVGLDENTESVQVVLVGDDPAALRQAALQVQREAHGIEGVGHVFSSVGLVRPEVRVQPDFARAADLGVTVSAIGETLRVATAGDYDQALPKLNLPDRQVPIRVRLPAEARHDLSVLERLGVPGARGNVPLAAVARLTMDSGPARIDRRDRQRRVTVTVELNGRDLGEVQDLVNQLPSLKDLPAGVQRTKSGDAEMMMELFGSFGLAMLTGIVCVYLVLVLLFKGFLQPVTIMAALPLSIGGAFAALLLTHHALSMPSLLGLLMLMGITVKNSILLVEYALRARSEQGLDRVEALLQACRLRARPIVMTSLAMGAGMLPLALGFGAEPSMRAPMAIAVLGGLLSSTVLSLLVVPAFFIWVDDRREAWRVRGARWARRLGWGGRAPGPDGVAPDPAHAA